MRFKENGFYLPLKVINKAVSDTDFIIPITFSRPPEETKEKLTLFLKIFLEFSLHNLATCTLISLYANFILKNLQNY